MLQRELENLFIEFLLNRGYSRDNLLSQFANRTEYKKTLFRPDIIIIDTINKEYIGLIEFKNRIDRKIEEMTLGQFHKYFSYLGTQNIPAFFVIPIDNKDFQIFEHTKKNTFQPISKDDFPNFKTLSAKRITEEKIKQRELLQKKIKELDEKKRRTKQSSYYTLLSLIVGITASLIAVFVQQIGSNKPSDEPIFCCDSLKSQYKNIQQKILVLEIQLNKIEKTNNKIDTIFNNSNLVSLEKRIKIIETGISENPEKSLSILQVRQEIELLKKGDDYSKELTQTKLDALHKELDIQNAWMLGVLIAIFGTILSLIIPNLLARRNGNNINT
jgi:hypothetical protein